MTRVGWLTDPGNEDGTLGGAEFTQREFASAAPQDVEIIQCPPGAVVEGLDLYVLHNVVGYDLEDIWKIEDTPYVKYVHDVWPHGNPQVREEVWRTARLIFCSPVQATRMGEPDGDYIPPPVNLQPFRDAAERSQERRGAVAVGPWMNHGKAPQRACEVAPHVDFYGGGPCAPQGSAQVGYDELPDILAKYKTFIHLPTVLEPFGRTVVEAWAAGCQVVTDRLVGARFYIEHAPEKLESAGEDFWRLCLNGS